VKLKLGWIFVLVAFLQLQLSATGVARLALVFFPVAALGQSSGPSKIDKAGSVDKVLRGEWVAPKPQPETLAPNPVRSSKAGGVWDKTTGQRFFCNTGYTLPACLGEITVLQKAVRKYGTRELAGWSWILVPSQDWKLLIASLGMHPNTPAFTCLELRETFVEEALVSDTGERTEILTAQWHMNAERLLEFAVAHELGHGLCNDIDEERANEVAKLLQARKAFSCKAGSR
jgi:hypothetical protein